MSRPIDNVDLHDATLLAVRVLWDEGRCLVDIRHGSLGHCTLSFSAFQHLTLPRKQDWGPSASIHSFSMAVNGHFEIEMQSGDLISIVAKNVEIAPT